MAFHPIKQDMRFVLPLDEDRPIEQDEQSEHLSHCQRYFANDAQSEMGST
jgi:hypothetical protein